MADLKKFLDQAGVSTLWTRVAEEVAAEAARAKAAEEAALKAAQDAQDEVDALETLVGVLPIDADATTVVEYINKKTEGIATDAALGELTGRVGAAENAIDAIEADYLKSADKEELQNEINALDSKKQDVITENAITTGDKTVVLDTSDPDYQYRYSSKYKISDDVITVEDITSITAKVRFTVIEGDMGNPDNDQTFTYTENLTLDDFNVVGNDLKYEYPASVLGSTAYISLESDGIYITNIEDEAVFDSLTITYKSTVEGVVVKKEHLPSDVVYQNALNAEIDRATAAEGNLQTQINTIMNNPDAEGAINSINEFTQYVIDHGTIAEGFRADINKNKVDIAANAKAIADQATADAAKYETKEDAGQKLTEAKEHANGLNTAMDTRVKALEAIDHDAYKGADETTLASAKAYTDEKNTAMNTRVAALEAIDHSKYEAAGTAEIKANAALESAKTYADGLADNYATAAQGALADTALQKTDITSGSANGTIAVEGADVAVTGLGSAAYTEATAYATAAQGALADTAVQKVETGTTQGTIKVDGSDVAVNGLGSAAFTNTDAYDAAGAAAQALINAKAYTDTEINTKIIALTEAEIDAAIAAATKGTN